MHSQCAAMLQTNMPRVLVYSELEYQAWLKCALKSDIWWFIHRENWVCPTVTRLEIVLCRVKASCGTTANTPCTQCLCFCMQSVQIINCTAFGDKQGSSSAKNWRIQWWGKSWPELFNKLDSMIGIAGGKCNGLWLPFVLPVVTGHILERHSVWGGHKS